MIYVIRPLSWGGGDWEYTVQKLTKAKVRIQIMQIKKSNDPKIEAGVSISAILPNRGEFLSSSIL